MPRPVLYGVPTSSPTRTVLLVAKAINLDLELKKVNFLAGENRTKEFLKKNPQHAVPILEERGKYICDSHAIATYLIGRYAKDDSLYPKDLLLRAQVDQRLHFDCGVLFVRLSRLIGPVIRKLGGLNLEVNRDPALEACDFMEKFLESDKYLAGNSLTVADLSCAATFSSLQVVLPVDPARNPKLADWYKRIASLSYYEEANGPGLATLTETIKKNLAEMGEVK